MTQDTQQDSGHPLRDAPWINAERMRIWGLILLAITVLAMIGLVVTANGNMDITGKPLGTDFISFWTAARLALTDGVAATYTPALHYALQKAVFPPDPGYYAFFYPPLFLLLVLPLGGLPYLAALAIWLGVTGSAYILVLRRFMGPELPLWSVLAYPAVLANAGHGQNGFLTTALLGTGLWLMDKAPWLAGLAFALLACKPHMLVLIPPVLLLTGRWRVLAATMLGVALFATITTAMFGITGWRGFLDVSPLARAVLEQNGVGYEKMQSLFAAVRLLGGGVWLAYGAQALAAIAAAGLLVSLRLRCALHGPLEQAMIAALVLVPSPFMLDYDLSVLAVPLAILATTGIRTGFMPYEKLVLLAAFALPALARTIAGTIGLPVTPLVMAALVWVLARRMLTQAKENPAG